MRSRRAFLKVSALGMGAVGAGMSLPSSATAGRLDGAGAAAGADTARPLSDISVWLTNNKLRFAAAPAVQWRPLTTTLSMGPPGTISSSVVTATPDFVRLIVANKFQDILGFGGCFSDTSCYVIDKLKQPVRDQLLHELCHPSEMGLNVHRTCIGSADSAASLYSYDDGDADPELKRFSIDHDRAYILPVLRKVREINPDVFLFSSPWSPPGWMKWNKSMLGGSMSRQYLASYAQYFLKFLQAYAEAGVPVVTGM